MNPTLLKHVMIAGILNEASGLSEGRVCSRLCVFKLHWWTIFIQLS